MAWSRTARSAGDSVSWIRELAIFVRTTAGWSRSCRYSCSRAPAGSTAKSRNIATLFHRFPTTFSGIHRRRSASWSLHQHNEKKGTCRSLSRRRGLSGIVDSLPLTSTKPGTKYVRHLSDKTIQPCPNTDRMPARAYNDGQLSTQQSTDSLFLRQIVNRIKAVIRNPVLVFFR